MAICPDTLCPFGFPYIRKRAPLDILKFLVNTLRNQEKKAALIQVDEDAALARSYEFINTCHNMNIIVQNTGVNSYSVNVKTEIPNKTLANITRALLLKSSHKK